MAEVRVQRLAAGRHQEHRVEDEVAGPSVGEEELHRVVRIHGEQHHGRAHDAAHAQGRDHGEPDEGQRPEDGAHLRGAVALDGEQQHEDHHGDRHDVGVEVRRRHLQALHRAQHRDRGRDHRAAVEHRGPQHAEQDQHAARAALRVAVGAQQREQREDPALAAVVGAQHEDHVLERDHEHQRPEDEREDAEDVAFGGRDGVLPGEALAQRVDGARADVAVHDAEHGYGEHGERIAVGVRRARALLGLALGVAPRSAGSHGLSREGAGDIVRDARHDRTASGGRLRRPALRPAPPARPRARGSAWCRTAAPAYRPRPRAGKSRCSPGSPPRRPARPGPR